MKEAHIVKTWNFSHDLLQLAETMPSVAGVQVFVAGLYVSGPERRELHLDRQPLILTYPLRGHVPRPKSKWCVPL